MAFRLTAVATAEPPPALLPPIAYRVYERFGIGLFHDRQNAITGHDNFPPDSLGRLEILGPLPAYASLVFRHVVLQTQRVEEGATSVTFTMPWERVAGQLGSVRARFVDAGSGLPLLDARADLSDAQGLGGGIEPDADGTFLWERQRPGLLELVLDCPGHERWMSEVLVRPGARTDLGTVAVEPATRISGFVRDAAGQPRSGHLSLCVVDRRAETTDIMSALYQGSSDGSGRFVFEGLGRRVYEIRPSEYEFAARPLLVDARAGDVENAVLLVDEGTQVSFEAHWPYTRSLAFDIVGRDGSQVIPRWWAMGRISNTRPMLPGLYEARLFDEDKLLRTIPFEVKGERLHVPLAP